MSVHRRRPKKNDIETLRAKAFNEVVCTFTGLSMELRSELTKLIRQMGGSVTAGLDDATTHLIAETCDNRSEKYVAARRKGLPAMLPKWIIEATRTDNVMYLSDFSSNEVLDMYRTPIFAGCEITITGFSGNERVDIGHLIEMHGGTFTGQMSKHTCTHLIAANESGEKYRRAKEWGTMHIVSEKWLRKCVEMKVRLPETKFTMGNKRIKVLGDIIASADNAPADPVLNNEQQSNQTHKSAEPAQKAQNKTELTEDRIPDASANNKQRSDENQDLMEEPEPAETEFDATLNNEQRPAETKEEAPMEMEPEPVETEANKTHVIEGRTSGASLKNEQEPPETEEQEPMEMEPEPAETGTIKTHLIAGRTEASQDLMEEPEPAETEFDASLNNEQRPAETKEEAPMEMEPEPVETEANKTQMIARRTSDASLNNEQQSTQTRKSSEAPSQTVVNKEELNSIKSTSNDLTCHFGSKCQTFYARDPFMVSRASMQYIFDEKECRFLDCISNVQHVGHCHPYVVQAVCTQLSLSTCNIRFLSPVITECAQELLDSFPPSTPMNMVLFCNSGSEANDLAIQLARNWTGTTGMVMLENAYHGHITNAVGMSPYNFVPGASIQNSEWIYVAPAPDVYRGKYRLADSELHCPERLQEMGQRYAEDVREMLEQIAAGKEQQATETKERATAPPTIAGFIAEAQMIPPEGYFRAVAEAVRAHGGLVIVDEVQTGFGRVGSTLWAHQLSEDDFVPDIVTLGNTMGNGFPVGVVITRKVIADKLFNRAEYNAATFGGNPVSCAAVLAVLDLIEREDLVAHSQRMGELFERELNELKARHECIGDVRGVGMFWGVDLVRDRESREPATELAAALVLKLRKESGVLLSADGPHGNILKFKPPLCFNEANLEEAVGALDTALTDLWLNEQEKEAEMN